MNSVDSKNFFKLFEICSDKNFRTSDYVELYNKYNDFISFKNIIDLYLLSKKRKDYSKDAKSQISKNTEIYTNYREILDKTKILANELKLKNSLEFSTLFTYLLWNGYFSKNNCLSFQSENRKNISGMLSVDIMSGIGVCLNFTDMLKDFLNVSGYNSASLVNTYNHNIQKDYIPKIHRIIHSPKLSRALLRKLCIYTSFSCTKGNHTFNLIKEDNKFYIYDPTNLLLLKPEGIHTAKLINGKGKIELNPFYSYSINHSEKETNVLDSFINSSVGESPYNRMNYIMTTEHCLGKFENNKSMLRDYYICTKENIDFISKKIELRKNK